MIPTLIPLPVILENDLEQIEEIQNHCIQYMHTQAHHERD